jgi:excinuclease ABC subunit A
VSGSGKSSLINETLYPAVMRALHDSTTARPGRFDEIEGLDHIDKVIDIDQSPIGRTPRSTRRRTPDCSADPRSFREGAGGARARL